MMFLRIPWFIDAIKIIIKAHVSYLFHIKYSIGSTRIKNT